MKKEDNSTKRQEFHTLKTAAFFDEETLTEVSKDIDELLKALDKKLEESREISEENDRIINNLFRLKTLLKRANRRYDNGEISKAELQKILYDIYYEYKVIEDEEDEISSMSF